MAVVREQESEYQILHLSNRTSCRSLLAPGGCCLGVIEFEDAL